VQAALLYVYACGRSYEPNLSSSQRLGPARMPVSLSVPLRPSAAVACLAVSPWRAAAEPLARGARGAVAGGADALELRLHGRRGAEGRIKAE
jgi:hypothetical protein